MSQYRLLTDHYIANQILQGGTIQSTADVGGLLPVGWIPTPNVDPLDTPAVNAFYAQGPQFTGLVRSVLVGIPVVPPVTYWKELVDTPWSKGFSTAFGPRTGSHLWSLTGLGSAMAPIGI